MNKKIIIILVILFLVFVFFFIPLPDGLTGYSIMRKIPFLAIEVSSIESHYEKFPSCYSIIEGKVINKGSLDAEDVLIDCSVLDENGEELGRSIENIGRLKKRDFRPFSASIDIKCIPPAASGQKYRCDVSCGNCSIIK